MASVVLSYTDTARFATTMRTVDAHPQSVSSESSFRPSTSRQSSQHTPTKSQQSLSAVQARTPSSHTPSRTSSATTPDHGSRSYRSAAPSSKDSSPPSQPSTQRWQPQVPPSPRLPHSTPQHHVASEPQTGAARLTSAERTSEQPSPSRSAASVGSSTFASPGRVKVRDLSHIQSFAEEDPRYSWSLSRQSKMESESGPSYEISEMPVTDIIEMVAGLLTKITTTNDEQHQHVHRNIPTPESTMGLSQMTNSVLAFHGKNIPSITILSYLGRIHKYCPTTYEVFLSVLVYFDRMSERVNRWPMQSLRQANQDSLERASARSEGNNSPTLSRHESVTREQQTPTPPPSEFLRPDSSSTESEGTPKTPDCPEPRVGIDPYNLSHYFVVDSYNIHRLIIAGVTCASKFFSDVFYTNSRYAKVITIPLHLRRD